MHSYTNKLIHECNHTRIQWYNTTIIQAYTAIHGYTNTLIHQHNNATLQQYTHTIIQ